MNLQEQTIEYINTHVRSFYSKAIEKGATVSEVTYEGCHVYTIKLGNAELTYIGTADGTAKDAAVTGDIF